MRTTDKNKQEEEKNLDRLLTRRDRLDDARMKHSDALDKYLLTFATGTLYLSITFTSAKKEALFQTCLLGWGWFFLLLSIASILLSFYFGEKAHTRQMEINDACIQAIGASDEQDFNEENCWQKPIEFLKILSMGSFFIGIASLAYFYFINL